MSSHLIVAKLTRNGTVVECVTSHPQDTTFFETLDVHTVVEQGVSHVPLLFVAGEVDGTLPVDWLDAQGEPSVSLQPVMGIAGYTQGFVVALNTTNMTALWGATVGSPHLSQVNAIAVDPPRNLLYVAVYHTGSGLYYKPAYSGAPMSPVCATTYGIVEAALMQFVASTGAFTAALCPLGSTDTATFSYVTVDTSGQVYLATAVIGNLTVDDGMHGLSILTPPQDFEAAIIAVSPIVHASNKLYVRWSMSGHSDNNDYLNEVVLDPSGNLYLAIQSGPRRIDSVSNFTIGDQMVVPSMCGSRASTDGSRMLDLDPSTYRALNGDIYVKISNTVGSVSAPDPTAVQWIIHLCNSASSYSPGLTIDVSSGDLYAFSNTDRYEWARILTLNRNYSGSAITNETGCCGGPDFGSFGTSMHKIDSATGFVKWSYGFAPGGNWGNDAVYTAFFPIVIDPVNGANDISFVGSFKSDNPVVLPRYNTVYQPKWSAWTGTPNTLSLQSRDGVNSGNIFLFSINDVCTRPQTCQNGGTCVNLEAFNFSCTCTPEWIGQNCEISVDDCVSNPCINGATCVDGTASYTCSCGGGFSGTFCETEINECASNPCTNGATCIDAIDSFTCRCTAGFGGTLCETDINECASNPCMNGATCIDSLNSFACSCVVGFVGTFCETNIDECASSPCGIGGACVDLVNSYNCTCIAGYSNIATPAALCVACTAGSAQPLSGSVGLCPLCDAGRYQPSTTGTHCIDCLANTFNDMPGQTNCTHCPFGTFQSSMGATDCIPCPPGLTGTDCATDINECASNPCQNSGTCVDGVNQFNCHCVAGYNGITCETDVNECASNPCKHSGTCTDHLNQFTCHCVAGYAGITCETDVNECASNPCQHSGTCVDGLNQFTCHCAGGYTGAMCETDINECASNPCQHSGTCADGLNQFNCHCVAGYNGITCETDVNECASNPCKHSGTCTDHLNQFTCRCVAGYAGATCETDINECASNPCLHGGTCIDHLNSYQCRCAAGYIGSICESDVNECASSPCQHSGTCVDRVNSFQCSCVAGYSGSLCQTEINECSSQPCMNGGTCTSSLNQFTCLCADGFNGELCQTDINECESQPCQNGGTCIDLVNNITCVCVTGFEGDVCNTTTPVSSISSSSTAVSEETAPSSSGTLLTFQHFNISTAATAPPSNRLSVVVIAVTASVTGGTQLVSVLSILVAFILL